jgi:Protein of unknown function (DUF3187)
VTGRRPGLLLAVAFLILAAAGPTAAGDQPAPTDGASPPPIKRGPAEIRDEQLFAQPRLTLPAVSPATVPAGRWTIRVAALWSNSFSWDQDVPGETPGDRRYLIDGEAMTVDATVRRGLTPRLDVGARLPFSWRGGGTLDSLIDAWHRLWNAPNGNRPDFLKDAFRVEGRLSDGMPFSWSDRTGAGLGDVELQTRWRFVEGGATRPSVALVGRVSLPTGAGPFSGSGVGVGGQLVLDSPLGAAFDLYAGAGATVQDPGPLHGIGYQTGRGHGFVALEWRPARWLSLVAETNIASRLVANVERYPGTHWVVNVEGRFGVARGTTFDLGFTENIVSQRVTTDFALHGALTFRP